MNSFYANNNYPLLHIQDQKSANIAGDTIAASAWRTITLNTVVKSQPWALLSNNKISLAAGTYLIYIHSAAYYFYHSKVKVVKVSGTPVDLLDNAMNIYSYNTPSFNLDLVGEFTITEAQDIEIQKYVTNTSNCLAANIDSKKEVYADVQIFKVA